MTSDITFKEHMFVYALRYYKYSPSSIDVSIPEVFLEGKTVSPSEISVPKLGGNIFLNNNDTLPNVSPQSTKYNYMTIPVIGSVGGEIYPGDRFVCQFINNNPAYGYIVARC